MKRLMVVLCAVAVVGLAAAAARADGISFDAESTQFGYQGTVQNLTTRSDPVAFNTTPRDGALYFTRNVSPAINPYDGYNDIQSNWYQHPLSDQNAGFFQINDGGTVTSAVGGWTQQQSGLWNFTLTVTGAIATAANSTARLWQPDAGMAWGGTFNNYSYTITATGMTTAVTDGWLYNTNNPASISGSFDGTFVSTQAVYGGPIDLTGRDTYSVHLNFSDAYWDGTGWNTNYGDAYGDPYSFFATPVADALGASVPEPTGIVALLGLGGMGLIGLVLRRRKAA